ncbi:hypothetical protein D9M68_366890 [compost metagenome]
MHPVRLAQIGEGLELLAIDIVADGAVVGFDRLIELGAALLQILAVGVIDSTAPIAVAVQERLGTQEVFGPFAANLADEIHAGHGILQDPVTLLLDIPQLQVGHAGHQQHDGDDHRETCLDTQANSPVLHILPLYPCQVSCRPAAKGGDSRDKLGDSQSPRSMEFRRQNVGGTKPLGSLAESCRIAGRGCAWGANPERVGASLLANSPSHDLSRASSLLQLNVPADSVRPVPDEPAVRVRP